MREKGFTLAEVLITLVIIGVIAAMTIPTLMGSTNEQEFRSAYKKGISAVGQAINLEYALYGKTINGHEDDPEYLSQMLKNHMSVIEDQGPVNFKTADGMIYHIHSGNHLRVDVNGDKGNLDGSDDIGINITEKRAVVPSDERGSSLLYD